MRDDTPRHWLRWRVTLAAPVPVRRVDRFGRVPALTSPPAEAPAADGIRHELVARVRQEIEAGTYDTEERWLAAEAELLRRMEMRT